MPLPRQAVLPLEYFPCPSGTTWPTETPLPKCELPKYLDGVCWMDPHWVLSPVPSSSFPSVEGLKDLLLGPCVDLPLASREPALPLETDSGSCPGVTASKYRA